MTRDEKERRSEYLVYWSAYGLLQTYYSGTMSCGTARNRLHTSTSLIQYKYTRQTTV